MVAERTFVVSQHAGEHFVVRLVLEVDADELLRAADDAQLDDGVQLRVFAQDRGHAFALEQLAQPACGLVGADDGEERGARRQRLHVERDVGGAAQALFLAVDADHRHRRLGRDALDGAEPVAVEHRVAHDEHARLGQPLALHGDRHQRSSSRCVG